MKVNWTKYEPYELGVTGARNDLERLIVELYPGPLNLEAWAGAALR